MARITPDYCSRNGYKIHYSRQHDNWLVSRKLDGQWTVLEEFPSRGDAIRWAKQN